jgi:hypothetical protein
MKPLMLIAVLGLGMAAGAKDKIIIEVVDSQPVSNQYTYSTPQVTAPVGNMTVTRPSEQRTGYTSEMYVHAIAPGGRHITLYCQATVSQWTGKHTACRGAEPGRYEAEISGDSVVLFGRDLGGKEHKMKYRYAGSW